jgi:aarF domain-containing kinase
MLSVGLCARRTTPFVRTTPPSNSFIRRLGQWPFRRPGQLPPLHPLRVGAGVRPLAACTIAIAFGAGVGFLAYENYQPFRHTVLAVVRCSRVAGE